MNMKNEPHLPPVMIRKRIFYWIVRNVVYYWFMLLLGAVGGRRVDRE